MNSTFNNQLPPGFRFHPSDEELITHYLQNKVTSRPLPASIIAEINLYKHNPWELPKKALFGEDEWYFFSPRDRKYPNGQRPNRAAGVGYWKATGIDRPILSSSGMKRIGVKKALVFHTNRPSKGQKTNWTMNEYRLLDTSTKSSIRSRSGSMRLDDWVLCRVRHKGSISKNASNVQNSHSSDFLKEDARSISANHEMITDCLQKGCELLASILADQPLPPIENISTLAFEGSKKDKIFNSAHKDDLNKLNSPVKVSSVDNNFNLWKWKTSEGIENQELPLSNQNRENKIQDHSLPRKMPIGDNSRGFTENQSQNDKFDSDLMDSRIIMNWTWMIAEME